jgi:anti-sigma-K factor RskA
MSMRRRREEKREMPEAPDLAALADGSLPPERRAALEAQVASSPAMADLLAEQHRAVALTRSAAEAEAPAGLRRRVEAQRSAPSTRRPRRLATVGVLGACVVAAVAIGIAVDSGSSGPRFQAALGPTGLAPGAAGDATLIKTSSGWRIHLDATGLPRLAGGRFYEAWLRNSAGVLVPIGTFNEGRSVTLWAGVSPERFTGLTVTREQADGNQASSGQKVLVGPIRTG